MAMIVAVRRMVCKQTKNILLRMLFVESCFGRGNYTSSLRSSLKTLGFESVLRLAQDSFLHGEPIAVPRPPPLCNSHHYPTNKKRNAQHSQAFLFLLRARELHPLLQAYGACVQLLHLPAIVFTHRTLLLYRLWLFCQS